MAVEIDLFTAAKGGWETKQFADKLTALAEAEPDFIVAISGATLFFATMLINYEDREGRSGLPVAMLQIIALLKDADEERQRSQELT